MIFSETKIPRVFEVSIEPRTDERGFFARSWCQREFEEHGLNPTTAQCNVSFNAKKGTLRGLHYQEAPFAEAKVVRCTQGSVYDVIVDLRPKSTAFKNWVGLVLSSAQRNMIYIPEGCAHGFITLEDDTELCYQMSEFYHPELSRGVRWNDPAFQILWPSEVQLISERDASYPDFEPSKCAC